MHLKVLSQELRAHILLIQLRWVDNAVRKEQQIRCQDRSEEDASRQVHVFNTTQQRIVRKMGKTVSLSSM